ncbi:substrate-binding domain-containing protein [Vulcanisaeta distributa]|uniref:Transcriptional regulator of molybdate metabolism, LysR family n=1 Tax=Vulcanisaeta distributa (strain DSM 14429 / JCM 11212 / NBRC 100878 / IC-017) TaxID=572478 RepID=E1QUN4_VULDI|nr:substrate-binding domain-containing protein [Vulcanisaeta distributa]ADN51153.1 transcriptional regulator of molybdate metabolism, LysR family [Vulcanisaeta distributa DSM 14429]
MGKPRFKIEVLLEQDGKVLMDDLTARLLEILEKKGSLLSVVKDLGLPYSRAWELINRLESGLDIKVVNSKRGYKGGMSLTAEGRELLSTYRSIMSRYVWSPDGTVCDTVYAGSDDCIVRDIINEMRSEGYCIDAYWVGSMGGLNMVINGLADIAGIHLIDPTSGEYNIPYMYSLGAWDNAVLIRGYMRLLGIVHRPYLSISDLTDILGLRMVNRNPGSGTRLATELLLNGIAMYTGYSMDEIRKVVKGYNDVVKTHIEVTEKVARGLADYGIAIAGQALKMGLAIKPIALEEFDIVVSKASINKPTVKEFIRRISKVEPRPGYVMLRNTGELYSR